MTRLHASYQHPWFQLKYMKQNPSEPNTGENIRQSFGKKLHKIKPTSYKISDRNSSMPFLGL